MHNFHSPYMVGGKINTKLVFKCPKCNHIADIAEYPKEKFPTS